MWKKKNAVTDDLSVAGVSDEVTGFVGSEDDIELEEASPEVLTDHDLEEIALEIASELQNSPINPPAISVCCSKFTIVAMNL